MKDKLNMKTTIEINEANFQSEVLESTQPVLVDFWAEWCGPCKMLSPVLDEIAAEQAGRIKVAKINIDENPALASRFRIQSIPTLLYFAGGQVRQQTVGAVSKKRILDTLNALMVTA
jgi:thioredoxin 1